MGKKPAQKVSAKKSGFQRKYSDIFKEKNPKAEDLEGPAKKKMKKNNVDLKKDVVTEKTSDKAPEKTEEEQEMGSNAKKTGKKPRFILFVGNLSYTTTKESLEKHFKKAGPLQEVRLLLNAQKEPKGCAFVEYKTSAAMLNALLYHHTTFEDRKINVEMTVGGGGNSSKRKKKIQEKRNKSNELIHKMLVQKKKSQSTSAPIK